MQQLPKPGFDGAIVKSKQLHFAPTMRVSDPRKTHSNLT